MNKVSNINLGGYPFIMDEEAYDYLRQYLDAIHRHFRGVEGNEEITSDIETRLAELFQERLGNRPIVNIKDVKDAVAVMGAPEDFGAEPLTENPKDGFKIKTGKRLFRNPEDQAIGGVCSGIAAYFGIQDPLWVRLFFVVVALSGGFGVPLYIILWSIMPVPKTAGDWLAMRGEPINFSNIGRIIQEGVENLSGKISEFGEEFGGSKKKSDPNEKNSFKEGMDSVGDAINGAVKGLQYIWKPFLFIVGFIFIIVFAASWISAATGFVFAYPFLNYLFPDQKAWAVLSLVNVFFLFGIPLVSLVLMVSRLLFGTRVAKGWSTGLGIMWGLSITAFFVLGTLLARQFSEGGQAITNAGTFTGDTLHISRIIEDERLDTWYNIDDEVLIADNKLMVRNVHLSIVKSKGKNFELVQESNSRGGTDADANNLAANAAANAFFEGNQLKISPYYTLNEGQKWRAQNVTFILKVPEGKFVQLEESITWMLRDIELADDHSGFWEHPEQAWQMTAEGLACTNCPKDADEDALSFEDFNALDISGKLKVSIEQGDEYRIELNGRDADREKVAISKVEGRLNVAANTEKGGSPLRLQITMPELKEVNINATEDVQIKGFTNALKLNARGSGYEVKVYGNMEALHLKQEGENKIDVVGNCELLNAELQAGARLDAEKPGVRAASIVALMNSRVDIEVREKLTQKKDESSRIRVKGNPVIEEN